MTRTLHVGMVVTVGPYWLFVIQRIYSGQASILRQTE